MLVLLRSSVAVLVLILCGLGVAIAGGDEYNGPQDISARGPIYFGFVRDESGNPAVNAEVTLKPSIGSAVIVNTNALGLYRSHVRKDVAPADVSVICSKPGFSQVQVVRRSSSMVSDHIQIDCILRPT
jgi:hypothetical protein